MKMPKKAQSIPLKKTSSVGAGVSARHIIVGLGFVLGAAWCSWLLTSTQNAVAVENEAKASLGSSSDFFTVLPDPGVPQYVSDSARVLSKLFEYDYCVSKNQIAGYTDITEVQIELQEKVFEKLAITEEAKKEPFHENFKQIFVDSILDLHASGLVEQCKFDFLLSWDKFKMEIITINEMSLLLKGYNSVAGFYNRDDFTVRIPQKNKFDPRLMQATLSHELQHAIDHYDNIHNASPDQELAALDFVFNFGNPDDSQEDFNQAYSDLMQKIENDLQHINKIDQTLDALEIPKNKRNSREKNLIAESGTDARLFLKLIKQEQYRPLFIEMPYYETFSDRQRAGLNANRDNRRQGIVFFGIDNTLHMAIKSDEPKLDPVDLNACKSSDLAKNLIFKIKRFATIAKEKYSEVRITSEFGAYMSQLLSQYPPLEKFLLPEFTAYRLSRASSDRANCLRGV